MFAREDFWGFHLILEKKNMESMSYENDLNLNLKATELRLGLPGSDETEDQAVLVPSTSLNKKSTSLNKKRALPEKSEEIGPKGSTVEAETETAPPAK